jgi:hypothetical protein
MVALAILMLLALAPLSTSAASSTSQTFTGTADILSVSGPCTDPSAPVGAFLSAAAAGAVNDTGSFEFDLDFGGPFPNQVVGEFFFKGAHSSAALEYTGSLRCTDGQMLIVNGQVWSGDMFDEATGKWYSISGAGRGNSITIVVGPSGFNVTFTGTAKLMQGPPVKHAE